VTCGFVVRGGWICALIGLVGSGFVAYVRTVKTASGATAVQIVYSSRRGSRDIEHLGSAHDDTELEALKAAAAQRLAAGQGELDLGLEQAAG
jgi:hypothetical protein